MHMQLLVYENHCPLVSISLYFLASAWYCWKVVWTYKLAEIAGKWGRAESESQPDMGPRSESWKEFGETKGVGKQGRDGCDGNGGLERTGFDGLGD